MPFLLPVNHELEPVHHRRHPSTPRLPRGLVRGLAQVLEVMEHPLGVLGIHSLHHESVHRLAKEAPAHLIVNGDVYLSAFSLPSKLHVIVPRRPPSNASPSFVFYSYVAVVNFIGNRTPAAE